MKKNLSLTLLGFVVLPFALGCGTGAIESGDLETDEAGEDEFGQVEGALTANCAYIQYCSRGSGRNIICKTTTYGYSNCGRSTVESECARDAQRVCGKTSPMITPFSGTL